MASPRIIGGELGGRHQPREQLDLSEEARVSRRASRELAEAAAAAAAAAPEPVLVEPPDDEQASPRELLLSADNISPGARRRNAAADAAEQNRQKEARAAAAAFSLASGQALSAAAVLAAKESLLKAVSRSRKQSQEMLDAKPGPADAIDEDAHRAWAAEREAASELPYEWPEATAGERTALRAAWDDDAAPLPAHGRLLWALVPTGLRALLRALPSTLRVVHALPAGADELWRSLVVELRPEAWVGADVEREWKELLQSYAALLDATAADEWLELERGERTQCALAWRFGERESEESTVERGRWEAAGPDERREMAAVWQLGSALDTEAQVRWHSLGHVLQPQHPNTLALALALALTLTRRGGAA